VHTPIELATVTLTYKGKPDQIRVVRADLRVLLADCPMTDELILCASELATNAAAHSRSGLRGATFTVRAEVCPGRYARIEVRDRGGPWHGPSAGPNGHHGLDIIRALASEWNIEGDQLGRTIWVRIGWPARDFG
jgi:anti-sigma regulatory factor (Ser/Thr protein kinase)